MELEVSKWDKLETHLDLPLLAGYLPSLFLSFYLKKQILLVLILLCIDSRLVTVVLSEDIIGSD